MAGRPHVTLKRASLTTLRRRIKAALAVVYDYEEKLDDVAYGHEPPLVEEVLEEIEHALRPEGRPEDEGPTLERWAGEH